MYSLLALQRVRSLVPLIYNMPQWFGGLAITELISVSADINQ